MPSTLFRKRHLGCFRLFDADDLREDGLEVPSPGTRERACNILPDDESRIFSMCCTPHFPHDTNCLKEQYGLLPMQPFPPSCDAEIRAGRAEGDDVHRLDLIAVNPMDVSKMFDGGKPLRGDANRERLNLRCPFRCNPRKNSTECEPPLPSNKLPSVII